MLDISAVKDAFAQDANLLGAQATADLAKGYAATWEKLYAGWKPLADRVLADRAAGRPIRPGDLYRMERFAAMMEQARAAYFDIAQQGRAIGLSTVWAAFDMAVADYRNAVRDLANRGILVPSAGDWAVAVNREALMAALGYSATGGPLHDLFAAVAVDGVKATRKALVSGIVAGKGTDQIARDMRKVLALNLYRSQLIARTEAHRVYREVNRLTAASNPGAFDGWMWRAACDARTCAICWSKHGSLHPASERMRTHPGCRCAAVPNPRSFASLTGEAIPDATAAFRQTGAHLFDALPVARQRAILGPARLDRYQQGLRLSQMVEDGPANRWGKTPRLIPLRRLGGVPPRGIQGGTTAPPAAPPPPAVPVAPHRGMRQDEKDRNARRIAAGQPPLEWNGKNWGIPGRPKQRTPVRRPRVAPAPAGAPVVAPAAGGGPLAPRTLPAGRPAMRVPVPNAPGFQVLHPAVPPGARPMRRTELLAQERRAVQGMVPLRWSPTARRWLPPLPTPAAAVTSHGGVAGRPRPAKARVGPGQSGLVAGVHIRVTSHLGNAVRQPGGVSSHHPAAAHFAPLPPARPAPRPAAAQPQPVAFPPIAAHPVPHPTQPGRQLPLPRVPTGARPMNAAEIARQAKRADAGQGDLVWKPNINGQPGQGHWGRAPGESRTRSRRAQVAFPSRPSMFVNNPTSIHQIRHPAIPRGARPMNDQELARQYRRQQRGAPALIWKPDPGGAMGQGHWGAPAAPAPAPRPAPAVGGHAPRGGAAPRAAVQAAGGAQLRRWLRWQAKNPNARPFREPPAAALRGGLPSTIGPLPGVRGGQPLRIRKLAEQTPVFARGRARTGQNQPMGWDPQRMHLGRAQPGEYAAARARSLARAQQAALRGAGPAPAAHRAGWGAPVPAPARVPTVLLPLPPGTIGPGVVKATKKPHTTGMTGTEKGMVTPRPLAHPLAAAEPARTLAGRGHDEAMNQTLLTAPIVRSKPIRGGSSSDGFEAWLQDANGNEIHVYIKPTSGQMAGVRGGGRVPSGIADFTETEREYLASRLNHLLGDPLDHQTSIIRDFGTETYEKHGTQRPIGRAVVNVWTVPPPGWVYEERPRFANFPDAERASASLFDALIFNTDRHNGNYSAMVEPNGARHIIAIDPSLAFPYAKDSSMGTSHGYTDWTDQSYPISPSDRNRLEGLLRSEVAVRAEFEPLIGQNSVDGLFKRARWMYQHGRTLTTRDLDNKVWWNS